MDLENRQKVLEAEVKVLRDTVYILTTRIYNLEAFIHHRYGSVILSPKSIIRDANNSYTQFTQALNQHPPSSSTTSQLLNSGTGNGVSSSPTTSRSSETEPLDNTSYDYATAHSDNEMQSNGLRVPYTNNRRHTLNATAFGRVPSIAQSKIPNQQRYYNNRNHPYIYNRDLHHYNHQNNLENGTTLIRRVRTPSPSPSSSSLNQLPLVRSSSATQNATISRNPSPKEKGSLVESDVRMGDEGPRLQVNTDEYCVNLSREGGVGSVPLGGTARSCESESANDLIRRGILLKTDRKTPDENETSGSSSSYHTVGGGVVPHLDVADEEDQEDRIPYRGFPISRSYHHPECQTCKPNQAEEQQAQSFQYHCNLCGEVFLDLGEYKAHKYIHSALKEQLEKKFVCEYCEKRFKRSQELQVHRRIHTGEKPYKCPICNKCFSQSSSVQLHLPVHTGEKPFHCPVCQKAFSRLSHMKKHCKNLHEQVPENLQRHSI